MVVGISTMGHNAPELADVLRAFRRTGIGKAARGMSANSCWSKFAVEIRNKMFTKEKPGGLPCSGALDKIEGRKHRCKSVHSHSFA